jgi:hypothetical protein
MRKYDAISVVRDSDVNSSSHVPPPNRPALYVLKRRFLSIFRSPGVLLLISAQGAYSADVILMKMPQPVPYTVTGQFERQSDSI